MPNTITAYTDFAAGTKAKSGEVDGNFSNHRGTLLPIEENTAAASNLTHYCGLSDHRFLGGFFKELHLGSTTTSWSLHDETAVSGNLLIKKNSTLVQTLNADSKRFSPEINLSALCNTICSASQYFSQLTLSIPSGDGGIYKLGLVSGATLGGYFSTSYRSTAHIQIWDNSVLAGDISLVSPTGTATVTFPATSVLLMLSLSGAHTIEFKLTITTTTAFNVYNIKSYYE